MKLGDDPPQAQATVGQRRGVEPLPHRSGEGLGTVGNVGAREPGAAVASGNCREDHLAFENVRRAPDCRAWVRSQRATVKAEVASIGAPDHIAARRRLQSLAGVASRGSLSAQLKCARSTIDDQPSA